MNCENCENYKPIKSVSVDKLAMDVEGLLHRFCLAHVCSDCPLSDDEAPLMCRKNIVRGALQAKGGDC